LAKTLKKPSELGYTGYTTKIYKKMKYI